MYMYSPAGGGAYKVDVCVCVCVYACWSMELKCNYVLMLLSLGDIIECRRVDILLI